MTQIVFIIGRKPICKQNEIEIRIPDETKSISRSHCRLQYDNGTFCIEDMNSLNGTFVNGGKIIQKTPLTANCSITVGNNIPFSLKHPVIQETLQKHREIKVQGEQLVTSFLQYASWDNRLMGFLIDQIIMALLFLPLFFITPGITRALSSTVAFLIEFLVGVMIVHFYYVVPISVKGQTLGRKLAGIRYIDKNTKIYPDIKTTWIRFLCYSLSGIIFYIGFLMPLWDKEKQALHDKIAGTIVIKSK